MPVHSWSLHPPGSAKAPRASPSSWGSTERSVRRGPLSGPIAWPVDIRELWRADGWAALSASGCVPTSWSKNIKGRKELSCAVSGALHSHLSPTGGLKPLKGNPTSPVPQAGGSSKGSCALGPVTSSPCLSFLVVTQGQRECLSWRLHGGLRHRAGAPGTGHGPARAATF